MPYKPRIVAGRVKDTGYPIDDLVLNFTQWDYENHESFHLDSWNEAYNEEVMQTLLDAAKEWGMVDEDETLETFIEKWKSGEWEPDCPFCLPLENVDIYEIIQEEEKE